MSAIALFFFFFNDTATTEIYTLSLHDALPIFEGAQAEEHLRLVVDAERDHRPGRRRQRSEEHTSELQSLTNLVCRLLLEKKNNKTSSRITTRHKTPKTSWPNKSRRSIPTSTSV